MKRQAVTGTGETETGWTVPMRLPVVKTGVAMGSTVVVEVEVVPA